MRLFNPLSARIFTVFGHSLLEDRVTQRSMGREALRYPPQYLALKMNNSTLALEGLMIIFEVIYILIGTYLYLCHQ